MWSETFRSAAAYFMLLLLMMMISLSMASPTIKGPPIAEKKEMKRIVRMGSDVKLICPISAFPAPIFEWFKDGEVINNYAWARFRIVKKSLKIKEATPDDTGIYVCKGTNGFGSQDSRIDLIVIDPASYPELGPDEEPDVASPVLTEETKSIRSAYRQNLGEAFTLMCEALAQPDPEITWYKDQIPITNSGPYQIERPSQGRSILTIDQLAKADSGLYTCMARNVMGAVARNFTLDVTGVETPAGEVSANGDLPIDFSGHPDHPDQPVMPKGPQNTTVEQGDKAVLECKVQSSIVPNIMWLKKLESREYDQTKDVIDLGSEKFRVIQQNEDEIQVTPDPDKTGKDEYLNKLVISEATESDAGMYYCFVKNPIAYKFKNAYLTVVPKTIAPIGGLESSPIFILVICLAVFVLFMVITIIVCVLRKRQKQTGCPNSTISESPEVRENLMRHHHLQQQQQQQSLYHQQLQQPQQQQTYMYQHLSHQQQQMTNNNHRSNLGHMNIVVNKLDQPLPAPPAPPAPPPPPPSSVHSSQLQHAQLYNPRHAPPSSRPSDNSSSHHSNTNNYSIQQNQYEVPHLVRYGPVYNDQQYPSYGGRNQMQHVVHY